MTGQPEVEYRLVEKSDADELGRLHVATWQAGYAGLLPAEFLAALDPAARTARWRDILAAEGGSRTVVAAVGEQLVGYVSTGPPMADSPPLTGWLYALYVNQQRWGTGVGYRLHEQGLEMLRSDGCRRAELWVLRTNERAIRFYRRQGWRADGRQQLDRHLPGIELDEIGMSVALV